MNGGDHEITEQCVSRFAPPRILNVPCLERGDGRVGRRRHARIIDTSQDTASPLTPDEFARTRMAGWGSHCLEHPPAVNERRTGPYLRV